MGCLIGHLPRQAAHFADIVKNNHATGDLLVVAANGRGSQLDGVLSIALATQHEGAAPEIDPAPLGQALLHRIAQRLAIRFVDQRNQVGELLADTRAAAGAGQGLCRLVHIVDHALSIRGDHALADGLQSDARLQFAASETGFHALTVADIAGHAENGLLAVVHNHPAMQLNPEAALIAMDELNLQIFLGPLTREQRRNVLAGHGSIGRANQVC